MAAKGCVFVKSCDCNTEENLGLPEAACCRPLNLWAAAGAVLIYILNGWFLKDAGSGWLRVFCRNYLNDLICPFFLLGCAEILLIWARHELRSLASMLCLVLGAGIFWELAGPLARPGAVADPVDLVCYAAGTCGYWFLWRVCR